MHTGSWFNGVERVRLEIKIAKNAIRERYVCVFRRRSCELLAKRSDLKIFCENMNDKMKR